MPHEPGRPSDAATKRAGREPEGANKNEPEDDDVDEASEESFPASDSPQWWSGEPETS